MAANRKTDPLEVTQVILVALREEEKRRREGLRVGAGFVFLAAGLFIVLVVGLISWEATYMLIVALVVSIALFVVGQALGILLAEFAAASSRLNTALDSLIAQKEAASGNQDNGKAEGKESKPAAGGAAETVPAREAGRPQ